MMQRFTIARHGSNPARKSIPVTAGSPLPGASHAAFTDGHGPKAKQG